MIDPNAPLLGLTQYAGICQGDVLGLCKIQ